MTRSSFFNFLLKTFLLCSIFTVISSAIVLALLYQKYKDVVVENPGSHLDREDILRRISMESPVYYRDGMEKIGVFFGDEHRQYVKYKDIPKDFINAIVSSEDKRFFDHYGVDPEGIIRAAIQNLKAGRVVAGGSTITQQTAKNLYYRSDRSWESKVEEFVNALRLEAHYSKEEILEFYINQFHVHSNGRGLGIAARYFFDKSPFELSLLECAYLAGSVKVPYRYNPFVGKTEENRSNARERAKYRTHYVLDRMYINGYITESQLESLKKEELEFRKGDFKYDHNIILDYVFDRLKEEPFLEIFQREGIDNPATAGIEVITTIDKNFQDSAQYGLRHNLSEIGTWLEGATFNAFIQSSDEPIMPIRKNDLTQYSFHKGVISRISTSPNLIEVDLGGIIGVVDSSGINRVVTLLQQALGKNLYGKPAEKDIKSFITKLKVGQSVFASIRSISGDATPVLDLEANTDLQGGITVLDQGKIRAMVGGQDNRNFNRAAQALRQLGSTFKPLIYSAALSLGWTPLSPLDNRRQGFRFQGQWYWPRADHDPILPYVSMAFAGISSENIASVSLLYHLTDLLTDDEMTDLATRTGLSPQISESVEAYSTRIRDKYGIIPSEMMLEEGVYESIKRSLKRELQVANRYQEAINLSSLPYGNSFSFEKDRRNEEASNEKSDKDEKSKHEYLAVSFSQIKDLADQAISDLEIIRQATNMDSSKPSTHDAVQPVVEHQKNTDKNPIEKSSTEKNSNEAPSQIHRMTSVEELSEVKKLLTNEELNQNSNMTPLQIALKRFYIKKTETGNILIYTDKAKPADTMSNLSLMDVKSVLYAPQLDALEKKSSPEKNTPSEINPTQVKKASNDLTEKEEAVSDMFSSEESKILLDGKISLTTYKYVQEMIGAKISELSSIPRYDIKKLIYYPDFRIMVGLQYVMKLASEMGVKSKMNPYLSMALGANEITLLESAQIYQTFLKGKVYRFDETKNSTAIIEQIKLPSGKIIYELKSKENTIFDQSVPPQIGRILRGVVERGTAYKESKSLWIPLENNTSTKKTKNKNQGLILPFFGKTGTTNEYANVAFIGFIPAPTSLSKKIPYGEGLTMAAYVGYDDNRPMKKGKIRIQGSSGALPTWVDTARGIVKSIDIESYLEPSVLKHGGYEVPIEWPKEMRSVAVNSVNGTIIGKTYLEKFSDRPKGSSVYDIYGIEIAENWKIFEFYSPFTPWGEKPFDYLAPTANTNNSPSIIDSLKDEKENYDNEKIDSEKKDTKGEESSKEKAKKVKKMKKEKTVLEENNP